MGLFRRSKELQFGTYNCVKPHASLIKQRKGNSFIEERGKLGGAVIGEKKKSPLDETGSLKHGGFSLAQL